MTVPSNFTPGQVLTAAQLNANFAAAASQADMTQIQNGTATDAGALTGEETAPVSRGDGLLQTTLTKIATWTLATFLGFSQTGTGAVARTVVSKLGETISSGDYDNLQDAVNAAAGKRLHIVAGNYTSQEITFQSDIEIFGDGGGATLIKLAAGANSHLLYATGQNQITIRDLTLDGNKANQTPGTVARCFYALNCNDICLDRVVVQNATDHGFHASSGASTDPLTNSQRVWLNKCSFLNNGTVIGANGGTGAAVSGSYLWATDCYSAGNILTGFKFVGQYVSAKGLVSTNNNCGGFSTGFDTVTFPGSVQVYESCYALANGFGGAGSGGDGFRHQGQVGKIIQRDCYGIGNAWCGTAVVGSSAEYPADVDIQGGHYLNNGQSFTASATVAGAGIASLSTVGLPNVPTNVRLSNVTCTDNQTTKTQTYGVQISEGANVYIGEGCRLAGNLTQSMFNAATVTGSVNLSPQIASGDFIARSNTPSSVTGTTTQTVLQTLTIPANTFGIGQRFKIRARGTASGTNSTKAFALLAGSGSVTLVSESAASQSPWFLYAEMEINAGSSQTITYNAMQNGGTVGGGVATTGSNVNTAITISIAATLGSASDTATCSSFYFEPIY